MAKNDIPNWALLIIVLLVVLVVKGNGVGINTGGGFSIPQLIYKLVPTYVPGGESPPIDETLVDDFVEDDECNAGCGIRGYDTGQCLSADETYPGSVQIGLCSEFPTEQCWCWNEEDAIIEETCVDSEEGNSVLVGGYAQYYDGMSVWYYDDCLDENSIYEYFCDGTTIDYTFNYCPAGTACVTDADGDFCQPTEEGIVCIEGDSGNDPYDFSYATLDGINLVWDTCLDGDTAIERYCSGSEILTAQVNCNSGDICEAGYCQASGGAPAPTDSDGDGYSDADEAAAGTNPNDANSYSGGPAETTADYCNALGFAWSNYMPGSSASGCLAEAYNVCFPVFGLQYEDSTYSDPSCCFKCS